MQSEWQPIETATKDGTIILLGYLDASGRFAARSGYWMCVHPKVPEKLWAWVCSIDPLLLDQRATHWMPLPTPPQEATDGR